MIFFFFKKKKKKKKKKNFFNDNNHYFKYIYNYLYNLCIIYIFTHFLNKNNIFININKNIIIETKI